jgi:hypothetical protein
MGFFRLVSAFLSIRSFHAVRSAPVSTCSLAAARRMCVCPIFPQPPGIGRKISGAFSTNAACCSSVSLRFPYPCLRGQRSKFPASYTKTRQSCVGVLSHRLNWSVDMFRQPLCLPWVVVSTCHFLSGIEETQSACLPGAGSRILPGKDPSDFCRRIQRRIQRSPD